MKIFKNHQKIYIDNNLKSTKCVCEIFNSTFIWCYTLVLSFSGLFINVLRTLAYMLIKNLNHSYCVLTYIVVLRRNIQLYENH